MYQWPLAADLKQKTFWVVANFPGSIATTLPGGFSLWLVGPLVHPLVAWSLGLSKSVCCSVLWVLETPSWLNSIFMQSQCSKTGQAQPCQTSVCVEKKGGWKEKKGEERRRRRGLFLWLPFIRAEAIYASDLGVCRTVTRVHSVCFEQNYSQ